MLRGCLEAWLTQGVEEAGAQRGPAAAAGMQAVGWLVSQQRGTEPSPGARTCTSDTAMGWPPTTTVSCSGSAFSPCAGKQSNSA